MVAKAMATAAEMVLENNIVEVLSRGGRDAWRRVSVEKGWKMDREWLLRLKLVGLATRKKENCRGMWSCFYRSSDRNERAVQLHSIFPCRAFIFWFCVCSCVYGGYVGENKNICVYVCL